MGSLVRLTDVTVRRGQIPVLSGVNLEVQAGECVAVMGPSGSGKSTLLGCIMGVLRPSSGQVDVLGSDFMAVSEAQRANLRRRFMGLVFQDPELLPELNVQENVALLQIFDSVARNTAISSALEVLDAFGVGEHARRSVTVLSGGQAQRVALARAFCRPDVRLVIADEPTASLDHENAMHVARLLISRAHNLGVGVIIATHDLNVAGACDRVVSVTGTPISLPGERRESA